MKKLGILGIISILALVVFASGCTSSNNQSTNTYSSNGISFNYPTSWKEYTPTTNITVVALGDPNKVNQSTNSPSTVVNIQKIALPSGTTLKQVYDTNYAQFASNLPNYKTISENTTTVDGTTAYVNVHTYDSNGVTRQEEAVWLAKNNNIYVILCGALQSDFASQQANFNMIINSFKVQ